MSDAVADVIERAVEIIDLEGWHQGDFHGKDVPEGSTVAIPHCMVGGLIKALTGKNMTWVRYDSGLFHKTLNLLNKRIREGTECSTIPDFNDDPETTWPDCRDLMLGVVKDLRNTTQNLEASGV